MAQIKGGGGYRCTKHFVGVVWGQKEEFTSFKAVATHIPEIGPIRLGIKASKFVRLGVGAHIKGGGGYRCTKHFVLGFFGARNRNFQVLNLLLHV